MGALRFAIAEQRSEASGLCPAAWQKVAPLAGEDSLFPDWEVPFWRVGSTTGCHDGWRQGCTHQLPGHGRGRWDLRRHSGCGIAQLSLRAEIWLKKLAGIWSSLLRLTRQVQVHWLWGPQPCKSQECDPTSRFLTCTPRIQILSLIPLLSLSRPITSKQHGNGAGNHHISMPWPRLLLLDEETRWPNRPQRENQAENPKQTLERVRLIDLGRIQWKSTQCP